MTELSRHIPFMDYGTPGISIECPRIEQLTISVLKFLKALNSEKWTTIKTSLPFCPSMKH